MINVDTAASHDSLRLSTTIPWPDDCSLASVIAHRLKRRSCSSSRNKTRCSKLLKADSLEKIGGFQICPTDNLLDHLLVDDDDDAKKAVYVFYHVSVLQALQDSVNS
jgi:hypothetical protein